MVTRRCDDRGSVLVLTLIFTVVLSLVVLALAEYAGVGLRTSGVATMRTETTADASSALTWAVEQFAKKELTPDVDCGDANALDDYLEIDVPTELLGVDVVTLKCAETTPITGEPVVHLIATTTSGSSTRTVETTVEVPRYVHGARVADWRVDLPIAVPAMVVPPPDLGPVDDPDPVIDPSDGTPPQPSCKFSITSAAANGKSGQGKLSISNDGGSFTGWTVQITQSNGADPWQFTWDASVTAVVTNTHVTVTNGPSTAAVAADSDDLFNVTAGLVVDQAQAIVAGNTLTCTFVSPTS